MAQATIRMTMDSETADIFSAAPAKDKNKLRLLWSILLREYQSSPKPVLRVMDQIAARAKGRGLTADRLESILRAR